MILDKLSNTKNYKGISADLDLALNCLAALDPNKAQAGDVIQLSEGATVRVITLEAQPRPMTFEFHRKMIDIHCTLKGQESIGLCPVEECPADTPFDEEKDVGLFDGEAVNVVAVPAGYFCVTFPEDAHRPGLGEGKTEVLKAIAKVRA